MKISDYFNNIRIRTRMIIVLILPIIVILLLMGNSILTRLHKISALESVYKHMQLNKDLADLAHQFQKERGISLGFLNNKKEESLKVLNVQRIILDRSVHSFRKKWDMENQKAVFSGQADSFQQLVTNLSDLKSIRSKINTGESAGIFTFYSKAIFNMLNIIQIFSAFDDDPEFSKVKESFSLLLWIQEYAGRERGVFYEMLSSGVLDIGKIGTVSSATALQEGLINRYKVIAKSGYSNLIASKNYWEINKKIIDVRSYFQNKLAKLALLNLSQESLGFGGLIHSFKNYVLRGTPKNLDLFEERYKSLVGAIRQFEQLEEVTSQEKVHLATIMEIVEQYKGNLKIARKMKASGAIPQEIDEAVTVNDMPALGAIRELRSIAPNVTADDWWELTSERINILKNYSDSLGNQIMNRSRESQDTAKELLFVNVFILLSAILIFSSLGFLLLRRVTVQLKNMSRQMQQMSDRGGAFNSFDIKGSDEIALMAQSFEKLMVNRIKAEVKLKASRQHLRDLSIKLQGIREEDKKRISREIHDELGQTLTAIKLDLTWLEKKIDTSVPTVSEKIKSIYLHLEDSMETVRRVSTELRPQVLDVMGFCDALRWQAERFAENTNVQYELNIEPEGIRLKPELSTDLFRIFQEALTNISRHSQATHVMIDFFETKAMYELRVKDDGVGFDRLQIENSNSLGLLGIRERALIWKGTAQITGVVGEGTLLRVEIPKVNNGK